MKGSNVRMPVVAGQFYEGSRTGLQRSAQACLKGYVPPEDLGDLTAGLCPST